MGGRGKPKLPPSVGSALTELRVGLTNLYGERLRAIYLFGSYARGDYREDSDVDVLIVLGGQVRPGEEINRYSRIVTDISLRHDLLITTVPVAEDWFRQQDEPLYENVMREGVAV